MASELAVIQVTVNTNRKLLFLITEDWYFCSHRLALAVHARAAGYEVLVATRVDRFGDEIRAAGLRLIPIGLRRRSMVPWREVAAIFEIFRIYRAEQPDIVHQVAMKPVLYGTLAAWICRVPVIINAMAGLGFVYASASGLARVLRPFVRLAMKLAFSVSRVRVLLQNPDDDQIVEALAVPAERRALIRGSGVDVERYSPVQECADPIVVTLVARMLADKGVGEFVEAARIVHQTHPEVCFRLVGPQDEDNPASIDTATLQAWTAEGHVQWCSGSDDIPGVWARSHIAVLPSYREGLPMALLEAAACGRAMVATDVPGCREIVKTGETGLLVPVHDSTALAGAVLNLVEDSQYRRKLGEGARRRVLCYFSQQQIFRQTLDLYRESLVEDGC